MRHELRLVFDRRVIGGGKVAYHLSWEGFLAAPGWFYDSVRREVGLSSYPKRNTRKVRAIRELIGLLDRAYSG